MGGKTAIAAGLVMGAVVGAALVGGVVFLLPGVPPSEAAPLATPAAPSAGPSSSPVASASPSAEPSGSSPSAAPPSTGPSAPAASPGASLSAPASPGPSSAAATGDLFGVGSPAPALVVPKVGGGTIDLAKLRGKPVWVTFVATKCPSCQDELPLMGGFAVRYADTGLQVVAVDVKEDEASVKAFMDGLGVVFPAGLDADGKASAAWGSYAPPVHFWIDRDGIVRYGALGGIGPDTMAMGLQKILPEVPVTP